MLKAVVNYFIKRKAKEDDRSPSKLHGNLIMKVAVVSVFAEGANYALVSKYVSELRNRGMKTVDHYLFFPKKKALEQFNPATHQLPFTNNDFSWLGKFKSDALKQGVQKEYDLVIDLSRGAFFACDVVIAKLHSQWKAGEHNLERAHLLDFMIDLKGDPDMQKLIHHLDHYISNFNKLNAA